MIAVITAFGNADNACATRSQLIPSSSAFFRAAPTPCPIPFQLTVLKNVMLPFENKMNEKAAKDLAIEWLEKLNMGHKINDLAKTLSGGEQQRTSIARAFAYTCAVPERVEGLLLLDEPFSSQDEINTTNIVNLIKQIVSSQHCACLVISHDRQVLESFCSRIITSQNFLN